MLYVLQELIEKDNEDVYLYTFSDAHKILWTSNFSIWLLFPVYSTGCFSSKEILTLPAPIPDKEKELT